MQLDACFFKLFLGLWSYSCASKMKTHFGHFLKQNCLPRLHKSPPHPVAHAPSQEPLTLLQVEMFKQFSLQLYKHWNP